MLSGVTFAFPAPSLFPCCLVFRICIAPRVSKRDGCADTIFSFCRLSSLFNMGEGCLVWTNHSAQRCFLGTFNTGLICIWISSIRCVICHTTSKRIQSPLLHQCPSPPPFPFINDFGFLHSFFVIRFSSPTTPMPYYIFRAHTLTVKKRRADYASYMDFKSRGFQKFNGTPGASSFFSASLFFFFLAEYPLCHSKSTRHYRVFSRV